MNILAFESSCDDTSVAVVKDGKEVLSLETVSQTDIHTLYGGVVPEIASRAHLEVISELTEKALKPVGLRNTDAVAVTYAPGLIGSLLVGVSFAKSLAYAHKLPLIPVHHIKGHVAGTYLTYPELKPPFIALIASGGHTHIVKAHTYTKYQILGRTRDDAVGESFDKIARVLGLGYPGGPMIESAAKTGDSNSIHFPRVRFEDNPYDFSFSGIKTAVINYIHQKHQLSLDIPVSDIAASFTDAVCDVLVNNTVKACKDHNSKKLVLAGGVSANKTLRKKLEEECNKEKINFFAPDFRYCGDNAAMIGAQAYYEYLQNNTASADLNAYAVMPI